MSKQKELMQQRRKMERAIYQKLSIVEAHNYIEERKKRSQEKYNKQRAKQAHKRQHLSNGLKFMLEDLRREQSDVLVFTGRLYGYHVSAAAILCSPNYYQVVFAVCSLRDRFNLKDAESYLGWRLQNAIEIQNVEEKGTEHPYKFRVNMDRAGGIKPDRLARLIELHIELDLVTRRLRMPGRMYRNALRAYSGGGHTGLMYLAKEERMYWWKNKRSR